MISSILPIKICVFLLAFSIGFLAVAQKRSKADKIRKIDEYISTIDFIIKDSNSPHLIFADVSQDDKPKWRKFDSQKALNKFRETSETYSIAYTWQKDGRVAATSLTLFSESGDWAKYVYLYFREDGTLAKVESDLRTFYGDFSLVQVIYFDERGDTLKSTSEYVDLMTNEPKRPHKDDILDNGDKIKLLYFANTNQLPYSHLLQE